MAENAIKGIDVSSYQGTNDWNKTKSDIGFAILRCGFGSDIATQDDEQFARNVTECERLNIPYGVYLYSYAKTEAMIDSEVEHTLRLLGAHKPFCVYIDMEDGSTTALGKTVLTGFAKRFCEAVKAKGFKVGVYANQNWFQNYLDVKALHDAGYSIWCAKYADSKPNIAAAYDIWQYSSKGSVAGINGNVDMNYMYNDIRAKVDTTTSAPVTTKTVEELAQEVIAGKWGNGEDRKNRLTAAGYNYGEVQARVDELCKATSATKTKTVEELAKEVIAGKWGNGVDRAQRLKAAGYNYADVQAKVNEICKTTTTSKANYYPQYFGTSGSIVTALNSLNIGSSFANRKKIAKANGITVYLGTAAQNIKLLNLLKQGKLIKP